MLHFLITTIVLHFIHSFISCRSFFFQYYTTVLCLQQLHRGFGFTVEHEKSDRTLYLSELTSASQSTKSKKQNYLSLPPRVPDSYWVIQGTKCIKPSRPMFGMVLSKENHKRFYRYIVRTCHMWLVPFSNVSRDTSYPNRRFLKFPSVWIVPSTGCDHSISDPSELIKQ
jgi:hypothetical protein